MLNSKDLFIHHLNKSVNTKDDILNDKDFIENFLYITNRLIKAIKSKNTIFTCGNGGSASDSLHLATELMVRLKKNLLRPPIPCIPLSSDMPLITAHSNDFNFNTLFSRSLDALGRKNDFLITFSTSGNSKNIINVLKTAKEKKIKTIGFFGNSGGEAVKFCDFNIVIKSNDTAHIQEAHITLIHILVKIIEEKLYKKN